MRRGLYLILVVLLALTGAAVAQRERGRIVRSYRSDTAGETLDPLAKPEKAAEITKLAAEIRTMQKAKEDLWVIHDAGVRLLKLASDDTVIEVEARIAALEAMYPSRDLYDDIPCDGNTLAGAYVRLAFLQYVAGKNAEPIALLDKAKEWADKAEPRELMPAFSDKLLREALERDIAQEKALNADPENAALNESRAMQLLIGPRWNLAAECLKKSNKKTLQQLAAVMPGQSTHEFSTLIDAITPCLALMPQRTQASMIMRIRQWGNTFRSDEKITAAVERAEAEYKKVANIDVKLDPLEPEEYFDQAITPLLSEYMVPVIRIVYILDHPETMTDEVLKFAQLEIEASTRGLSSRQKMAVFVVSEKQAVYPVTGFVPATRWTKAPLSPFFSQALAQPPRKEPLAPLLETFKSALALKPQLIYLISDGNFDAKLCDEYTKLNADSKVRTHAIGFLKLTKEGEANMLKLAADSNGKFKHVVERDLR